MGSKIQRNMKYEYQKVMSAYLFKSTKNHFTFTVMCKLKQNETADTKAELTLPIKSFQ